MLTAKEVAVELGVSVHTVRTWTSQGRLPVVKVGRCARYRQDVVEEVARNGLPNVSPKRSA